MTELMFWLIGLKQQPDWVSGGTWQIVFQSPPQGLWVAGSIALIVAAIAGIWYLYKKEGRNLATPIRLLLSAMRCMILACVALMLLEIVLVITVKELVPSDLLVLVDTSESMGLSDPQSSETVARRTTVQPGVADEQGQAGVSVPRKQSRLELAKQAIGELIEPLSDGRRVSVYGFAGKLEPLAEGESIDSLVPNGVNTAVGEAIKNALAAHRGQPLAGIILVTDGQSNAGSDPRSVAQQAGKDGVSIYSLAVGSEQGPSNARLVDVEVSPVVFLRDLTEVSVIVESQGLRDRPAVVTLEKREVEGGWSEVGRDEVVLGEDATLKRLSFSFTPSATGKVEFRARISDVGVELTESDNTFTKSIRVIRQSIRVLLIAGYPAPEVQFLRNALLRDVSLEFTSWLQSAGKDYEHIGHRPIRRLPVNSQELDHYDAIILFDPDMRKLGPQWSEMLTKFVGNGGGGLIYIAGETHSQPLFDAAAGMVAGAGIDVSWLRILPIVKEPGLYRSAASVRLSSQRIWNLELSPEGNDDPVFQFSPDPSRNREILTSLPGMYWHFPVTRAKPGAKVLAYHGDPRMRNSFGRHVLMATQRYGPGRTVFLGFDSTYRWRYLHEKYFDGFWARLVDRVGRGKALGGRYPFTLTTDKSVYRTGDRVKLRAQMVDSSELVNEITELGGEVELANAPPIPIQLVLLANEPGVMEASFTAEQAGAYTVRVMPTSSLEADTTVRPATLNFRVEPPREELDNPKLNRSLLEDIARASGGQVFSLANFQDLPEAIKVKRVERVREYRDELWDAPLLFGLLMLLLTVEWFLRKRYRMA